MIRIVSAGYQFWRVTIGSQVFSREGGFDSVVDWAQRKRMELGL